MFLQAVASVLLIQLVILTSGALGDDVTVEINNGRILGEESSTEENTTFCAFRGIPYAQPPIGDLRFNSSLPAKNWTGAYNATYERSICTSVLNNNVVGSEDCLFLNVYTPELPSQSVQNPNLPVIVWIHGGGFFTGSGNLGLHGADRFLNNDVIIVSINYRLGIFGFISTKDNVLPGNYGLKDQVLALRWVKNNIGYFGGDSNNVTIMGESAGAASVIFIVQSKLANGLFHKAIAESGSALSPWSQAGSPRELAFKVGLLNGILTVNSTILKIGLRKVNYKTLQRSTTVFSLRDLFDSVNGLTWAPTIEPESVEAVLTGYSYSTFNAGNFSRVPLLCGFNSLEGRLPSVLPWIFNLLLERYIFPTQLTPNDMNANTSGKANAGSKIKKYYFNDTLVPANADLINYISDDGFVRGIVKTAELVVKWVDVYLYRFAFTGGIIGHVYFDPEGVSHTEELQFLWLTTAQNTSAANLTALRMVEMWTNFAKTGNPTPYLDENVNVTWPVVNSTGGSTMHYFNIDTVLEAKVDPEQNEMEFWHDLYAEYGNEPYNTF